MEKNTMNMNTTILKLSLLEGKLFFLKSLYFKIVSNLQVIVEGKRFHNFVFNDSMLFLNVTHCPLRNNIESLSNERRHGNTRWAGAGSIYWTNKVFIWRSNTHIGISRNQSKYLVYVTFLNSSAYNAPNL